jgi:hypothetical protein
MIVIGKERLKKWLYYLASQVKDYKDKWCDYKLGENFQTL